MELIDFHNIRMDENLKWGTQKNYFTTKKYVELFLKEKFKKSGVYLSDLNYRFISERLINETGITLISRLPATNTIHW